MKTKILGITLIILSIVLAVVSVSPHVVSALESFNQSFEPKRYTIHNVSDMRIVRYKPTYFGARTGLTYKQTIGNQVEFRTLYLGDGVKWVLDVDEAGSEWIEYSRVSGNYAQDIVCHVKELPKELQ